MLGAARSLEDSFADALTDAAQRRAQLVRTIAALNVTAVSIAAGARASTRARSRVALAHGRSSSSRTRTRLAECFERSTAARLFFGLSQQRLRGELDGLE